MEYFGEWDISISEPTFSILEPKLLLFKLVWPLFVSWWSHTGLALLCDPPTSLPEHFLVINCVCGVSSSMTSGLDTEVSDTNDAEESFLPIVDSDDVAEFFRRVFPLPLESQSMPFCVWDCPKLLALTFCFTSVSASGGSVKG